MKGGGPGRRRKKRVNCGDYPHTLRVNLHREPSRLLSDLDLGIPSQNQRGLAGTARGLAPSHEDRAGMIPWQTTWQAVQKSLRSAGAARWYAGSSQ